MEGTYFLGLALIIGQDSIVKIKKFDAATRVTNKGDCGELGSFCRFAPVLRPRLLAAAWATNFGDPLLPDCLRRAGLPGENLFPRQALLSGPAQRNRVN